MLEKRGLKGCKKLVSKIIRESPDEIRANSSALKGEKDVVKLTVTQGKKGNSLMRDIYFRKLKGKCVANVTAILTYTDSCMSTMGQNKSWNYSGDTADFTWFQDKDGNVLNAKPLGNGCIVTVLADFKE